jgi:hypothetical protein
VQRLVGCKVRHSGGVRHSVTGYVICFLRYINYSTLLSNVMCGHVVMIHDELD